MFKLAIKDISKLSIILSGLAVIVPLPALAASCLPTSAAMSNEDMQKFLSDPSSLLTQNSLGGLPLSNTVRLIAASNSDALATLVGLAKTSSGPQSASIGSGLASAVAACTPSNPQYADQIQQAIAASNNQALITAFADSSNQIKTAAINGAGAGGALGGGTTGDIGGSGNTNGSSYPGNSLFSNSPFAFSQFSAQSGTGDTGTGATGTTSAGTTSSTPPGTSTASQPITVVSVPGPVAGGGFTGLLSLLGGVMFFSWKRKSGWNSFQKLARYSN